MKEEQHTLMIVQNRIAAKRKRGYAKFISYIVFVTLVVKILVTMCIRYDRGNNSGVMRNGDVRVMDSKKTIVL